MLPAILKKDSVLPENIKRIFEDYTEDDYKLFVTGVDYVTDKFNLDFFLDVEGINDKDAILQNWTIEVVGHRKSQVTFGYCKFLKLIENDPLLWEFTDFQCELYFNGHIKDPAKLFYELYLIHKKLFKGYKSFDVSFCGDTEYFKQFQYSNGLLAKGSKNLMEHYAECLKQNGIDYSTVGDRRPTYWDGNKHIPEKDNLKLLLLGRTFVIAENFSFVQNNENSR